MTAHKHVPPSTGTFCLPPHPIFALLTTLAVAWCIILYTEALHEQSERNTYSFRYMVKQNVPLTLKMSNY